MSKQLPLTLKRGWWVETCPHAIVHEQLEAKEEEHRIALGLDQSGDRAKSLYFRP